MVIHDVDRNHYHYLSTVPEFVTKHQSELEYFQTVIVDDVSNKVVHCREKSIDITLSNDLVLDSVWWNDCEAILVHMTDDHQHVFYLQTWFERYGKYGVAPIK